MYYTCLTDEKGQKASSAHIGKGDASSSTEKGYF
jgi:hypothetical protein